MRRTIFPNFKTAVALYINSGITLKFVVVIGWLWVQYTINWDELFLNKNCPSPKDEDNLKFRNNVSQLIVNCANNPITSLFRGQLYEINEQKRGVYKK